jgi:hypothetical protein
VAVYNLAFCARLDNYAVLQTFVENDIQPQDSISITGATLPTNGTYVVISTEPYEFLGISYEGDLEFDYNIVRENQFIVVSSGSDVDRNTTNGTVTVGATACTWITNQNVLDWLGVAPATANDTAFVTVCTDAANALAFRRRRSSGYTDALATAPSADVKLGTIMYAGGLYRARGTSGFEGFAAFESMSAGGPAVAMGEILRLWGCNRAQVA